MVRGRGGCRVVVPRGAVDGVEDADGLERLAARQATGAEGGQTRVAGGIGAGLVVPARERRVAAAARALAVVPHHGVAAKVLAVRVMARGPCKVAALDVDVAAAEAVVAIRLHLLVVVPAHPCGHWRVEVGRRRQMGRRRRRRRLVQDVQLHAVVPRACCTRHGRRTGHLVGLEQAQLERVLLGAVLAGQVDGGVKLLAGQSKVAALAHAGSRTRHRCTCRSRWSACWTAAQSWAPRWAASRPSRPPQ